MRVAAVTSHRRLRRQITRSLASLGWSVTGVPIDRADLEAILDQGIKLYVVDADDDPALTRWFLAEVKRQHPDSGVLMLSSEVENSLLSEVLTDEGLNNFVARQAGLSTSPDAIDEVELMVACQKLIRRDIFGLDKYLTTWGILLGQQRITSTEGKDQAINELERFLGSIDCYGRIVAPISMVAEELMTNGLYNAPRDAQGMAKYRARDRADAHEVEPHEAIEFSFGCDGRYVGLSVRDQFGALDREAIVNYLQRCFRGEPGEVEKKQGGAGLGLYMVFNSITQLAFNIEIGRCTEVVALFYVRDGVRAFRNAGRSLHIFLQR